MTSCDPRITATNATSSSFSVIFVFISPSPLLFNKAKAEADEERGAPSYGNVAMGSRPTSPIGGSQSIVFNEIELDLLKSSSFTRLCCNMVSEPSSRKLASILYTDDNVAPAVDDDSL